MDGDQIRSNAICKQARTRVDDWLASSNMMWVPSVVYLCAVRRVCVCLCVCVCVYTLREQQEAFLRVRLPTLSGCFRVRRDTSFGGLDHSQFGLSYPLPTIWLVACDVNPRMREGPIG